MDWDWEQPILRSCKALLSAGIVTVLLSLSLPALAPSSCAAAILRTMSFFVFFLLLRSGGGFLFSGEKKRVAFLDQVPVSLGLILYSQCVDLT